MHRVTLDMELSCDDAFSLVNEALHGMSGVAVERQPSARGCRLTVTIETDDADVVDIVREIAWHYDPTAVQHSLHLAEIS